jgi:hypothetical protein
VRFGVFPLIVVLGLAASARAQEPNSPEACALSPRGSFTVNFVGNQPLVQVSIDGRDARLLLDTGAEGTILTEAAASRLGLPADPGRVTVTQGVGGTSRHANALVQRLQVGDVALGGQSVGVAPYDIRGGAAVDGLLGLDTLARFDVDFDLPHATVTLYRGRNCITGTPDWREPAALKTDIGRVPGHNLLYVPVTLDSHPMLALIDTGADVGDALGVVDARAAQAAGTTSEVLRETSRFSIHGAAPTDASGQLHRFRSMMLGEEIIPSPVMAITALPTSAGEMLVGIRFARAHRIWVSLQSRRMFVGYRVGPP